MDIEIKNADEVISVCQQILNYNKQVSTNIDSLENSLTKINASWESNGHDKESYVAELEKQIKNLNILEESINNLANSLLQYAENIKATSAKAMS